MITFLFYISLFLFFMYFIAHCAPFSAMLTVSPAVAYSLTLSFVIFHHFSSFRRNAGY